MTFIFDSFIRSIKTFAIQRAFLKREKPFRVYSVLFWGEFGVKSKRFEAPHPLQTHSKPNLYVSKKHFIAMIYESTIIVKKK